jgi:heme exporter protein D
MQDFLTMRGYGFYVWGSFGACAFGMLIEPLWVRQRLRNIQSRLPKRELNG